MKTEFEIENDFYKIAKESELGKAVGGKVYHAEMRPLNDASECVCVNLLTGLDEQLQQGLVNLNIYVPDIAIDKSGRKVADRIRIGQLQRLALRFIADFPSVDYQVGLNSTPLTMLNEEIGQHFINVRIDYKRLSQED